jgi:hypothetical protein
MGGQAAEKQQSHITFCRVNKKFGGTDEARGSDNVASSCKFFKGAFSKDILKQLRIIAIFLPRSIHGNAAAVTMAFVINLLGLWKRGTIDGGRSLGEMIRPRQGGGGKWCRRWASGDRR